MLIDITSARESTSVGGPGES